MGLSRLSAMSQHAGKSTAAEQPLKTHLGGVGAAAIAGQRLRQGARQVGVVHCCHADDRIQQGIWHRPCT